MGPVLVHKKIKNTDYRLSLIPFGGYCGMKGEKDFQTALDEKRNYFTADTSSFYGVHPFRRLCIALAGPLSNAVFAGIAFTIIAIAGYTYYSADNRIILADEVYPDVYSPARDMGLRTGDRIISLNDNATDTFLDISRIISTHPDEDINAVIERGGARMSVVLHPVTEKSTAAGKIGVVNWIDPVIGNIPAGSIAENAGLQNGDVIVAVNGVPVFSAAGVSVLLRSGGSARITCTRISRGADILTFDTVIEIPQNGGQLFSFEVPAHTSRTYSFFSAAAHGIAEFADMCRLTVKGLASVFRGADITQTVSGPARITVMIGDTAREGFGESFNTGMVSVLNLLALISISLFMMNLLPVPVLDGGIVLFSLIEIISGKQLKPKFLYYIQFVGIAFIAALFLLAIFSDTRYFLFKNR
jgi:regulator of sigma E protease